MIDGFLIVAGSVIFFLILIILFLQWPQKTGDDKANPLEPKVATQAEPKNTQNVKADVAGIEIPIRPAGLVARPSLIEAIGKKVIDLKDITAIAERSLDHLSRYMRAQTLLFLMREGDGLKVKAAHGLRSDDFMSCEYGLEENLEALLDTDKAVSLNMPNISSELTLANEDKLIGKLAAAGNISLLLVGVGKAGIIALAGNKADSFTKLDEAAVEGVAVQLRYILENIQQNRVLEQSVSELDKLLSFINEVSVDKDLSPTLIRALRSAIEISGASSGSVLLFDENTDRLTLAASVGLPESVTTVEIGIGEGIAGWVAAHRRPIIIKDLDNNTASSVGLGTEKVAVAISLPITLKERLIGVLNLGSNYPDHDFTVKNLTRAVRLLSQVGMAVTAGQSSEEWQGLFLDMIKVLSQIVESRDPFSQGHAVEVSKYALDLAREMKLDSEEVQTIEIAALLHDIGVAGITDGIFRLNKPLSSVERLLIRSHPRLAVKALAGIPRLSRALPYILHHHENFDGTGYIDGLKGDEIPLGARIIAVAEAYSAMTAERPYRLAKSKDEALNELNRAAGTQFDPQVVSAFSNLPTE